MTVGFDGGSIPCQVWRFLLFTGMLRSEIRIAKSELSVITKAKDLCSYIMTVTDKSPKRFRFTLVSRLQNYALDVIHETETLETMVVTGSHVDFLYDRDRVARWLVALLAG